MTFLTRILAAFYLWRAGWPWRKAWWVGGLTPEEIDIVLSDQFTDPENAPD